jgi:hypothetical protein
VHPGSRVARDELAAAGIALWLVNVRAEGRRLVEAALEAAGAAVPPTFESLAEAVDRFDEDGCRAAGHRAARSLTGELLIFI